MSFPVETVVFDTRDAMYKQFSGAAMAGARGIARLSQMTLNSTQRPLNEDHIKSLRLSMEEEVRKGEVIHAYIDVEHKDWGTRTEGDVISLLNDMNTKTRLSSFGKVSIGVLPPDIHLQVCNGQHRLHAYCRYMVDHWDEIKHEKPALNPLPTNCSFAQGLAKSPAKILAQDDAYWIVNIEYIRE